MYKWFAKVSVWDSIYYDNNFLGFDTILIPADSIDEAQDKIDEYYKQKMRGYETKELLRIEKELD